MQKAANAHQAEAWNGYEGHHWADNRTRYDEVNEAMNAPLFEAAAIGGADWVLDVGCGTGRTTRLAARRAVHGEAVGIDLSAPMVARARMAALEQGVDNVTHLEGDAQVHPFAPGGFDVAISRGGIMYFEDPVAAFGNIARALSPGGRLAFVTPRNLGPEDDFVRALAPLWELMRRHAPATDGGTETAADAAAGEKAPGPDSLADPRLIERLLGRAGFAGISTTPLTVPMVLGHDPAQATEFVLAMGPMHYNLRAAPRDDVDRVRTQVAENLGEFEDSGRVTLRAPLWTVGAVRSAPAA
ncbi:Ubiquinone/menaquinone biosynthesis C-methylase UbiE [Actinacidiphila yanglinensis]|uniref:Ubiquinone/menaquinone biosynthesis C-methylase UbiE n=1 Tax=Actinacidiphila yanglinensis TaxID=310779 RepID=A0A1H5SAX3_9ACTN|nr:class I SAM-dependent methyltransferase [Actinacidiphila yanglinensis]SEF47803.1 Ubiquinone/menaquinone biosynthesis C-methylase UbiE [Actinacidiphila yanglinensis]